MVVALAQLYQNLGSLLDDVFEGDRFALRGRCRRSETENVGEYDLGIFAGLKWQSVQVDCQEVEKVFFDDAHY